MGEEAGRQTGKQVASLQDMSSLAACAPWASTCLLHCLMPWLPKPVRSCLPCCLAHHRLLHGANLLQSAWAKRGGGVLKQRRSFADIPNASNHFHFFSSSSLLSHHSVAFLGRFYCTTHSKRLSCLRFLFLAFAVAPPAPPRLLLFALCRNITIFSKIY